MDTKTLPLAALNDATLLKTDALVDGRWIAGASRFAVIDPATGETLADVADLGTAETQAAIDAAIATGRWEQVAERRFEMPVSFDDFDDFERRMMRPTFADHQIDDAKLAQVRAAFEPHLRAGAARFDRPMHVRLLRKPGAGAGARAG